MMETEKIISRCGVVCSDCEYYPSTCPGCPSVEGKVFWLNYTGDNVCDIYSCCAREKQLPHCGHCTALPCKHYERRDPNLSYEQNEDNMRRQIALLDALRQLPGTEQPMHLYSETALWKTKSEFTDACGNVSKGIGESAVTVSGEGICNHSWALVGIDLLENDYLLTPVSATRLRSLSENPSLGTQEGFIDIAGPRLYSKFFIRGTELNGYEVITREGDTCHARGALYNGDDLINTWTAKMTKQ